MSKRRNKQPSRTPQVANPAGAAESAQLTAPATGSRDKPTTTTNNPSKHKPTTPRPAPPHPAATTGPDGPRPIQPATTTRIIAETRSAMPKEQVTRLPTKPTEQKHSKTEPAPRPVESKTSPRVSEKELVEKFPLETATEEEPVVETPPHDIVEPPAPSGPQVQPMFVVMVTPELAPVAKVGGLADVVFGLGRELEMRGNAVELILPKYDCMRYDHIYGLCKTYENLWVPWFGGAINCTVWFGFVHGRKCFFIEPHSGDNYFNRGAIYGQNDDVMRFAFFSRAALEFMLKTGKHPDIIHCHDWQTALTPVLLYEIYQHLGMTHPRVCFTVHNFKHQGVTGDQVLSATG